MTLWLMRHPKVLLPEPTCYGTTDVPIDQVHLQACATKIINQWPQGIRIICSEMQRTQEVAMLLGSTQPLKFHHTVDARLNEMDFGNWEMVPWSQIPQSALDVWVNDFSTHPFGGKESVQQVIDRVRSALNSYLSEQEEAPMLCVCHAGTIRALYFLQTNPTGQIKTASEWPTHNVPYGEIIRYPFALDKQ